MQLLSENEELKAKITSLECENMEYKKNIDHFEECKEWSQKIMQKHYAEEHLKMSKKSEEHVRCDEVSSSKAERHVSFVDDKTTECSNLSSAIVETYEDEDKS